MPIRVYFARLCVARLRIKRTALSVAAIGAVLSAGLASAQGPTVIKTDTSWGRSARTLPPTPNVTTVTGSKGTVYTVPGKVFTIPESAGKTAGTNLFHSFDTFNIGQGDAAVFTTNTASLTNVISRVTGNAPSFIEGLLALQPAAGSKPNFFLINPSGVTLSAGAQVDVPAAFHVSTASNLRFTDGTVFKAGNGSDSTLSVAAPQAFGFLGKEAALTIKDIPEDRSLITSSLDVSAPSVVMSNAEIYVTSPSSDINPMLSARLAGMGAAPASLSIEHKATPVPAGSVHLENSSLSVSNGPFSAVVSGGTLDASMVTLSAGSSEILPLIGIYGDSVVLNSPGLAAYVAGGPEGPAQRIVISGGTIAINDSTISGASGVSGAIPIDIEITASATLDLLRSSISTAASEFTTGGAITLSAHGLMHLTGDFLTSTRIQTYSSDSFKGGDISIKAHELQLVDHAEIGTFNGAGTGDAGRVQIDVADNLKLANHSVIRSVNSSQGASSGTIEINAAHIALNGALIEQQAAAASSGQLGDIRVNASVSLSTDFPGILLRYDAAPRDAGALKPATIYINTPSFGVRDLGRIGVAALEEPAPTHVLWNGEPYVENVAGSPLQLDSSWGHSARGLPWTYNGSLPDAGQVLLLGNLPETPAHTVSGSLYVVGQNQGQLAGANLFYSFDRFGILADDAVLFTTTTPSLQNIIARVTGGSVSRLDGLLLLRPAPGSSPNFFFINPAGVAFSQYSQIDVPGAFHVSAAHSLHFADESRFDAGSGANSQFSAATPTELGFLGAEGAIDISSLGNSSYYESGRIPIVTSYFDATAPSISANGVDLHVVSPSRGSSLRLHATASNAAAIPLHGVPTEASGGDIDLNGRLEVNGPFSHSQIDSQPALFRFPTLSELHASTFILSSWDELQTEPLIGIYGPSIRIAARALEARLFGDPVHGDAALRKIILSGGAISLSNSSITSYLDAETGGRGPDIDIHAQSLSAVNSHIQAEGGASGPSGAIKILVDRDMKVVATEGAYFATGIETKARGSSAAGDVTIDAQNLLDGMRIASDTDQSASASSGRVHVGVTNSLTMLGGGQIASTTSSATGRAGAIDVSGARIEVGGGGIVQEASAGSSRLADGVTVTAHEKLLVSSGGIVISNSASVGDPGAVQPSSVSIVTPSLEFEGGHIGFMSSAGNVPSGRVTLNGQPFTGEPNSSPIEIDGSWGRTPHDLAWSRSAEAEGEPIQITGRGWLVPYARPPLHYVHVIPGNLYTIAESDGKLAGDNLFHSFGRFNIPFGDAAVFTTVTPTLHNIIARVTGLSPSSIEGLLMLDPAPGSKPNLFLINPAGVTITSGAAVDVPAAFHLSTASRLNFADGVAFTAGRSADSTFSAATPTEFGFTGAESNVTFLGVWAGDEGDAPRGSSLGIRFVASLLDIEAHDIKIEFSDLTLSNGGLRFVAVGDQSASLHLEGKAGADVSGNVNMSSSAVKASYLNNDITIAAGDLTLNNSQLRSLFDVTLLPRDPGSPDIGGVIDISAHSVTLDNAFLTSATNGTGPQAGNVSIDASSSIRLLSSQVSSDVGQGASRTTHLHAPDITLRDSRISVHSGDQPPDLIVDAERLTLVHGAISQASENKPISAASITINADFLTMTSSSIGRSRSRLQDLNLGNTRIFVSQELSMHDSALGAGIGEGPGGAGGKSGDVTVRAPSIVLDASSITSDTSMGGAGSVDVSADKIVITNGGSINTSTFLPADAGSIQVVAKSIQLDGQDSRIEAAARQYNSGLPGNILISAGSLSVANGARISVENASVLENGDRSNPGNLSIIAPDIKLTGGGKITAETTGNQAAKQIGIKAQEDGRGALRIAGDGTGEISTSTAVIDEPHSVGAGKAGDIALHADSLTLSGVSIVSESRSGTTGAAGKVSIDAAGDLSILNARVATDTFGKGAAGNIKISAGSLLVDPSEISSRAAAGSSGQPGSIDVTASHKVTVTDGSRLTIQNDARSDTPAAIQPVSVTLAAPQIDLLGGEISAASAGNIAAGGIRVAATDQLVMRDAAILTTARDGNGGGIQVNGGRLMLLDHSQIATSVLGNLNGNGGDISVTAQTLVMNTGFIQANTTAPQASGGNLFVNVSFLVASGGVLLNGLTPVAFDATLNGINVIQAAAPEGVSGNVRITAPVLDVVGDLRGLSSELITLGPLGKDLCRVGAGSSLTPLGRGGLRPTSAGLLRPETVTLRETQESHVSHRQTAAVSADADNTPLRAYRCEKD